MSKTNPVQRVAQGLEEHTPKWMGKGSLKGDMVAIIFIPIVIAVIMIVAAVLIMAWVGVVTPTFNTLYAQFATQGMPINTLYQQIPQTIFGNIYVVISWFPVIFWFVMLSVIMSALFINDLNPLIWLIDVALIPVFIWICAELNNIIYVLFNQNISVGLPPNVQTLKATLSTHLQPGLFFIQNYLFFAFVTMLIFVIVLAIRVWFFKPQNWGGGGQQQAGAGGQHSDLGAWQ